VTLCCAKLFLCDNLSYRSRFFDTDTDTDFDDQRTWKTFLQGTVLRDRFRNCGLKLTDLLGINKGRGWFLNFLEGTSDF
jgi:hypothetical protein